MTEQDDLKILNEFKKKIITSQKPLDNDIAEMVNNNFWDLLDDKHPAIQKTISPCINCPNKNNFACHCTLPYLNTVIY
jgi:hypothetical protein